MRGKWLAFLCLLVTNGLAGWDFPAHESCAEDTDLTYFLDSSNKLSVSSALSASRKLPLKKSPQNLHYGYTAGTVWIYLKVKDNPEVLKCILELANPQLDDILIYHVEEEKPIQVSQMGDLHTFQNRFYKTRHYTFPFRTENQEFLISLKSSATMTVPLTIVSRDQFVNEVSLDYLLLGLFYGIMIFFIFFGFHSFISFRDKAYLLYGLFALSILFFFMDRDGINYQFFWPNATYWKHRSVRVFASIAMAFGVSYFIHILQIKSWWIRTICFSYVGLCFLLALSLLIFDPHFTNIPTIIVSFGTPILMIALPMLSLKRDKIFAPFMLAAGLTSFVGLFVYSLSVTNFIESSFITENSMKISTLFEFVFLTFGIHQKIKIFHRSRLESKLQFGELEKKSAVYKAVFDTTNMMAHDVRRPLDKMTKFLNRIQKLSPEEVPQYVLKSASSIGEDIKTAEGMLSELLAIGSKNDYSGETHLCDFIPQMANGKYKYTITYGGPIKSDFFHLKRVFENLIKNARQATAGKTDCRFWMETQDLEKFVKIIVGNSGSSIEKDDLDKIFNLFFTKGKREGSGVGLAIVEKFIHDYGGEVWAESNGYTSKGETVPKRYKDDYVEFHMTLPKGEENG